MVFTQNYIIISLFLNKDRNEELSIEESFSFFIKFLEVNIKMKNVLLADNKK